MFSKQQYLFIIRITVIFFHEFVQIFPVPWILSYDVQHSRIVTLCKQK
jgi:hypothetical protein